VLLIICAGLSIQPLFAVELFPSYNDTTRVPLRQNQTWVARNLNHDQWLDILTASDGLLHIFWGSSSGFSEANQTTIPLNGSTDYNLKLTKFHSGQKNTPPLYAELDAATVRILAPKGEVDSNAVITPQAVIANLSPNPCSIPTRMHIGTTYAETVQTFIQPFQAATVSFPDWHALQLGTHAVRCSTMLAGDTCNENDARIDSVTVVGRIDAEAISIIAPVGTIDSGTVIAPACSVKNSGTSPESIPVRIKIGTGYADTVTICLEPGRDTTVTFSDWVASPIGLQAVRCSTMLANDEVPENDMVSDAVIVKPVIDAAAISIVAPTGYADSGTVITPQARIANYSTGPKLIPAIMQIGAGYIDTTFVNVAPNETTTVSFTDWSASPLGLLAVRCSTALADDEHPENDTVSTTIEVGIRIDAAALAILAPTGTLDSGAVVTPVCSIANNGTRPANIPVHLKIGAGYEHTESRLINPGHSDTLHFPDWTASPLGTIAVTCSTALEGDTFPENDTASTTVNVIARVDAALTAILAPTGTVDSSTVITPMVIVTNNGTRTESIPVRMAIAPAYEELSSIQLAPSKTDTLTFANWIAQPVGIHAVVANTYLADDENPDNDTAFGSVTVRQLVDAAPLAIIRPAGTVDSGTVVVPLARVVNYSSSSQTVPVLFTINDGYSDVALIHLGPGENDTVRFDAWTATISGTNAIRCSTALEGDQYPENNTLSSQVFVRRFVDATVRTIVSPTGMVDSGTVVNPRAIVSNLGTGLRPIPVFMWVGDEYQDFITIVVPPSGSDTVTFAEWIASPPGWQTVRCSTALAGDENPDNDQLIDSVLVNAHIDAAAIEIISPVGTVDSGTVIIPCAKVANFGTSPAAIPVQLSIGSSYTDTTSVDVAPGETATVFFLGWTASPLGMFQVRCSTMLAGDENPGNDTATSVVTVITHVDAAVTAILAPVGPIDSGTVVTPTARIINNSMGPKLIPVRLQIGDFYSDTRLKQLPPAEEDTVQFAPWYATQLGTHAVRCSTALAGDENPENDTLSVSTNVRVRVDAAVTEIIAPVGIIDSGSVIVPQATVKNNSAHSKSIPVHMLIGASYWESTAVFAEPGSSQTVAFPEWTARVAGTFAVCCSVSLAGDLKPANDTLRDSVIVATRHDVGCYRILVPTGTIDSGTIVIPKAMVANYGIGPEFIPVHMAIGPIYADTQFVNINAGESTLVSFSSWIASPTGMLSVRCSTALAADTITGNDQTIDSVLVITHPDAAVTDLYAPVGRVDSGTVITPFARVCNYGTSPATVPVIMCIGDFYEQTRLKCLGIGAKDTVLFPDWTASPLGTHTVRCSTALTGDENPANDYKTDSVTVNAFRDAATIAIISPAGRVDSGTTVIPKAIVANYGTSPGFVPVRMCIGPDYDSVTTKLVRPGTQDTITFPAWSAILAGNHAVRCSTELRNDYHNENDYLDGIVAVVVRKDAACLEIQSPKGVLDSGTVVTPVVRIANYSTGNMEIPLFLRIGSDYFYSRRKTLNPGQADTVIFRNWQAHPHGYIAVTCSTALAGDEYPKNNALHEMVYVQHQLDAAVTGIIVPVGSVDSGHSIIPKAWIANYSPGPVSVPVEMRIGDFYSSMRTKLLPSGGSDTVYFETWLATEIGRHTVRCTTHLDMDENPANDFKDAQVDIQWHDAACINIIAPTHTIMVGDTVIPKAIISNLGTMHEKVPTVFRIGNTYAHLAYADSLAPGDSAELTFAPWVAEKGEFNASCSTALHIDMDPVNDKKEISIFGVERSVILEPDSATLASPGATVDYALTCINNGNAADTIDITNRNTRNGWEVQFFDSTGNNQLPDLNRNSIPDIGSVSSGDTVQFICRITVPITELGRVTDSTEVRAISGDNSQTWDNAHLLTTVKPVADILIDPDRHGETAPGQTKTYRFTITNLGNIEDYADLVFSSVKNRWIHKLTGGDGKELNDRNRNGRPDAGPITPLGGTKEISFLVTPDQRAGVGEQDTSYITAISFADENVRDQVTAVTLIAGSVTDLIVEPDQGHAHRGIKHIIIEPRK